MAQAHGIEEAVLAAITGLRRHGAKVHCVVNTVAQPFAANVLLACGATPSMTVSPEEIGDFVRAGQALAINLGTLDEQRRNACLVATRVAGEAGIPFILDPVMCHLSAGRLEFASELLDRHPAILRTNAMEADALADRAGAAACHVVTGEMDRVRAGEKSWQVANGHPFLTTTIATGCAQGALMAALLVHAEDPAIAAIAALAWFGIAGEIAAGVASGPGSFAPAFLDALWSLPPHTLAERMRLS